MTTGAAMNKAARLRACLIRYEAAIRFCQDNNDLLSVAQFVRDAAHVRTMLTPRLAWKESTS